MLLRKNLPRLDPGLIAGVFSFSLCIAFVPGWSDPGALRFPMLAVAACVALFIPVKMCAEHWLGIAFIAWAALSLFWSEGIYEGVDEFLRILICAGLFVVGGAMLSLRPIYIGLGIGIAVNSALAVAQWFGFDGVVQLNPPAGFFANKHGLAEPAVLTMVALVVCGPLWLAAAAFPAVFLPMARGSIIAVGVALLGLIWTRSKIAAVVLLCVGVIAGGWLIHEETTARQSSILQRFAIWSDTIRGMTPLGAGLGSFYARYPSHEIAFDDFWGRPYHAHNDVLEMAYELGPGVLLYLAILGLALMAPFGPERLVLLAFMTEGCFEFPLHTAIPSALLAVAAGNACRRRLPLRLGAALRGERISRRLALAGSAARRSLGIAGPRQTGLSV